jgi:hypothetical protein
VDNNVSNAATHATLYQKVTHSLSQPPTAPMTIDRSQVFILMKDTIGLLTPLVFVFLIQFLVTMRVRPSPREQVIFG